MTYLSDPPFPPTLQDITTGLVDFQLYLTLFEIY